MVLGHGDEQLALARESAAWLEELTGRPVLTRIEPLERFWIAEDYHQKYYLRNDRVLAAEFRAMFGTDEAEFRESTAAAHVNGYIAGDGTATRLTAEIDALGLTEVGRSRLLARVGASTSGIGCSLA